MNYAKVLDKDEDVAEKGHNYCSNSICDVRRIQHRKGRISLANKAGGQVRCNRGQPV